MLRFAAGLNHGLHLIAVVIWIGGLAYLIMSLHPVLREKLPNETLKPLFAALRQRYIRSVGILLGIILVTGGLNVYFTKTLDVPGDHFTGSWMFWFAVKLALVTGLISLYFMNLLYKTSEAREDEAGIPWSRPAFILGVLIIFIAALLKFSHS